MGRSTCLKRISSSSGKAASAGQVGGIELPAGDGEHEIPGMDQRREQHRGPFGLETQGLGREILDAEKLLDQLAAIDDLAVTLLLHPVEDVSGVLPTDQGRACRRRGDRGNRGRRCPVWSSLRPRFQRSASWAA